MRLDNTDHFVIFFNFLPFFFFVWLIAFIFGFVWITTAPQSKDNYQNIWMETQFVGNRYLFVCVCGGDSCSFRLPLFNLLYCLFCVFALIDCGLITFIMERYGEKKFFCEFVLEKMIWRFYFFFCFLILISEKSFRIWTIALILPRINDGLSKRKKNNANKKTTNLFIIRWTYLEWLD